MTRCLLPLFKPKPKLWPGSHNVIGAPRTHHTVQVYLKLCRQSWADIGRIVIELDSRQGLLSHAGGQMRGSHHVWLERVILVQ